MKLGIKMLVAYRVFLAPDFRENGVVTYAPSTPTLPWRRWLRLEVYDSDISQIVSNP